MKQMIDQIGEVVVAAVILFGLLFLANLLMNDETGLIYTELKTLITDIFDKADAQIDKGAFRVLDMVSLIKDDLLRNVRMLGIF